MQIGLDWVSLAIFLPAWLLSNVRSIPIRIRYAVLTLAMGAIVVYRLPMGFKNVNGVFTGLAGALVLYYAVRTATARDIPKVSHGDDD